MFDRPDAGEGAVLVNASFGASDADEAAEFIELVRSAGAAALAVVNAPLRAPEPRFLVGTGKVAEIHDEVERTGAELVVFNQSLSPAQERNLEKQLGCRVLDRRTLILDIFAQRAKTFEGKLQVELAQLRHLSTRLIRGWTHLERQKGGIGLRGPGETQLETDRRLIGDRIRRIRERLERVRSARGQNRRARARADVPVVSLVGYTNAGKSTLFNRLTGAHAFAEDRLFATLDPTMRRLSLGPGGHVVLADTVGFIRDLPHSLIAAFRSTLEETRDADLLLHVVDSSARDRDERISQVEAVLTEIGAGDVPRVEVFNKCDLLAVQERPASASIRRNEAGDATRIHLSAVSGDGLDELCGVLAQRFGLDALELRVTLPPDAGRLRAMLFESSVVRSEYWDDAGSSFLEVAIDARTYRRLCQSDGLDRYHSPPNRKAPSDSVLSVADEVVAS